MGREHPCGGHPCGGHPCGGRGERTTRLRELQHGLIRRTRGHAAARLQRYTLRADGRIGLAVTVASAPGEQSMQVTQQMIRFRRIWRLGIGCTGHTLLPTFCDCFYHALNHGKAQPIHGQRIERGAAAIVHVIFPCHLRAVSIEPSCALGERRKLGAFRKARHHPAHRSTHVVSRPHAHDRTQHRHARLGPATTLVLRSPVSGSVTNTYQLPRPLRRQ